MANCRYFYAVRRLYAAGGLLMGPSSAHLRKMTDKVVRGFTLVNCKRLYKSVLHFVSIWGRSHSSHFGRCRVVTGTLKIEPRQMNHVAIAVVCWACCLVCWMICARNHSFAKRCSLI
jgi:hypothetical protein